MNLYACKTVCYSMIVLAFNYHLSIITIMGKSDNVLYINILLNVRCVLKLIQNRLKRLVFSWRQATFLVKTTWKVSSDPGGRAWEIRVWRRWRPGSSWNRDGDVELFICLVWGDFMHCFSKNEADSFKGRLHFYSSTCTFTITLRILPWPIPGAWPSSGK